MIMMPLSPYQDCLRKIYRLSRFGVKLGLSNIRGMLNALGNPQSSFPCIHIAGTNGKGSIAASLSFILNACGYTVGLYTSPHLIKFNERIQINNHPITDERMVTLYEEIKHSIRCGDNPTFFEVVTAMALYEFRCRQVDWAVIETGMGGRLDATNIIDNTSAAIITNISLEHQQYLGKRIAQIAAEKGGIIKPGVPVISGVRQPDAGAVIENLAQQHSAPYYRFGRDFKVRRNTDGTFHYFGIEHHWRHLQTSLPGNHQIDNAALTLCACELLKQRGVRLEFSRIKSALLSTKWPGRLELVSQAPMVVLDGAHNLMAVKQLTKYLQPEAMRRKLTFVIGILNDKPYRAMLTCLLPLGNRVILTRPRNDRALSPDMLWPTASGLIPDTRIIPDVGDAVECAIRTASEQDMVCITGSLFVVGEARERIQMSPELVSIRK